MYLQMGTKLTVCQPFLSIYNLGIVGRIVKGKPSFVYTRLVSSSFISYLIKM